MEILDHGHVGNAMRKIMSLELLIFQIYGNIFAVTLTRSTLRSSKSSPKLNDTC